MSKLRELEKRLASEPENLGLRVMVAGALREAGRQAEAVELYRSVAIAYRDQGRSQQAIAVCRSILEIAPDDQRCHALLASLVAGHKGRTARDSLAGGGEPVYGDDIVLEVGTPPPPDKARERAPSIPPSIPPRERAPSIPPSGTPSGAASIPARERAPSNPPSGPASRPPSIPPSRPPSTSSSPPPRPPSGPSRPPSLPPIAGRTPTPPQITTPAGSRVERIPSSPRIERIPARGERAPSSPRIEHIPPRNERSGAPPPPAATVKAGVSVPLPARTTPAGRSSARLDETPLPVPMPYHVADPTTKSLKKLSEVDLAPTPDPDDLPVSEDAQTRPGAEEGTKSGVTGLSNAARRISSALIKSPEDLSAELDTRQRPRIESNELAKITQPPPTVPVELQMIEDDDEDGTTSPPSITRERRAGNLPPPGDDDTEQEQDDGVPTLSDEQDEPTRPRDTPLDLMIRTENEGPFGTAFFQPLPAEHRKAVLDRFHRKSVKKGTTVIRQGEVGHSLVVVVKGQLDARADRKGGPIDLGKIANGEFIGEGSLLARTPSPVQIVAATDCELLLLTPRDFYEIAGAFPALWAELKDTAERRKRELESHFKR